MPTYKIVRNMIQKFPLVPLKPIFHYRVISTKYYLSVQTISRVNIGYRLTAITSLIIK